MLICKAVLRNFREGLFWLKKSNKLKIYLNEIIKFIFLSITFRYLDY